MSVNLSPLAGAGWQFFTNNGIPLAGGKLETYLAGTSTPAATYTSSSGGTANTNPIVLNSAGRTASEVWLTNGTSYKFILKDSSDVLIATYDNISGIGDSSAVLAQLANTSDIALGDALVGFKQSNSSGILANATARTVHGKLQDFVHVRDFGAVGNWNGTTGNDDSAAIQNAINAGIEVDMRDGNWRITRTISVPAGRYINLGSGNISASCGSNPLFTFGGGAGAEGFTFYGGSGVISGTADSVFEFEGSTNWASSPQNYARQIRIEGLNVSSTTLNKFINMKAAVRQVFVSKCQTYTPNGVTSNGKCVEIMFDKSIIFGSSGAAGTTGIKLSSDLGANYYNEGWTFSDCTIDAFENTFDIADIFVFEVTNSYIDGGTNAFIIRKPTTTTHTREILIHGNVIGAPVTFATSAAGILTYSNVADNIFLGGGIVIGSNHSHIAISDCQFESSSSGVAVNIGDNVYYVTVDGLTIDATYVGGVIMSGSSGTGCSVRNVTFAGTGSVVYATRGILAQNLDFGDGTSIGLKYKWVNVPSTTYAVGATLGTISKAFARGEVGHVVMGIPMTGCSVRNVTFAGTGSVVYATRGILAQNLDFGDGTSIGLKYKWVNVPSTTYAVGATLGTISKAFARGEVGHVVMGIPMTGLSATPGSQAFSVSFPSGVNTFGGTSPSWGAGYIFPNFEKGILTAVVPYYATTNVTGNVTITNYSGSTVTVTEYHAWFGLIVD